MARSFGRTPGSNNKGRPFLGCGRGVEPHPWELQCRPFYSSSFTTAHLSCSICIFEADPQFQLSVFTVGVYRRTKAGAAFSQKTNPRTVQL